MTRNDERVTCHGARRQGNTDRSSPMNHTDQPEKAEPSLSPNRHLVEVPDGAKQGPTEAVGAVSIEPVRTRPTLSSRRSP